MSTWLPIVALTAMGPGLLFMGIRTLRTRSWYDGIPAAELLIDRVAGIDPPSRTDADRRFSRVGAWMNIGFGSFFTLCLAAVVISLLSE